MKSSVNKLIWMVVALIVLLSLASSWFFISGVSYTLGVAGLIGVVGLAIFLAYKMNRTNRQVFTFFDALKNDDSSQHFPDNRNPFMNEICGEMNRITALFQENRQELEEKRIYYESIIRTMTHEIRNSITPIVSLSADLLRHADGQEQQELREGLAVINSQAHNLNAFLDSYHRLTHLPDPTWQEVALRPLFDKLIRLVSSEPEGDRIRLEMEADYRIQADPNLLTLALLNLLKNALQAIAGKSDGQVVISIMREPEQINIQVKDNGAGISSRDLFRIFTPFYTTKPNGSGIGLNIAQRIVRLHHGTLAATSVPGQQTVFSIQLPLQDKQ